MEFLRKKNIFSVKFRGLLILIIIGFQLVTLPLIPFHFFSSLPGLNISQILATFVRFFPMVLCIFAALLWINSNRFSCMEPGISFFFYFLLGFWFIVFFNNFVTSYPGQSFAKTLFYFSTGELICLIISTSSISRKTIHILVGISLATASLVGLMAVLDLVWGLNPYTGSVFTLRNPLMKQFSGVAMERAIGTVGNPIPLGTYLAFMCPFFFYYTLQKKHILFQISLVFGFALVLCGVFFSYSRGAWLGLTVSSVFFLGNGRKIWLLMILILSLSVFIWGTYNEKVGSVYEEWVVNYQVDHRVQSWPIAFEILQKNPLTGVGLGMYGYHAKPLGSLNNIPDNSFLLVLAENGILGLALRLGGILLLGQILKEGLNEQRINHKSNDRLFLRAFLASYLGFAFNMISWDALYFPLTRFIFWVFSGMAIAFLHGRSSAKS